MRCTRPFQFTAQRIHLHVCAPGLPATAILLDTETERPSRPPSTLLEILDVFNYHVRSTDKIKYSTKQHLPAELTNQMPQIPRLNLSLARRYN